MFRWGIILALAVLGDELQRNHLPRILSPPLVHLAEGALPDPLEHVVVLHRIDGRGSSSCCRHLLGR